MREIGGYLELEHNFGSLYHNKAIALNSARNCLQYLIQTKNIKHLFLPKLLCSCIKTICKNSNVKISFYNTDYKLRPNFKNIATNEFIYFVNYYGQINNSELTSLSQQYPNLIVDNVQAYFQKPIPNVDTIYSCRKFFGVPDGGFLYTNLYPDIELELEKSYDRMKPILGRFEDTASNFYSSYCYEEKIFDNLALRKMSKLTKNLLRGINYEEIKLKRERNFLLLDKNFSSVNQLSLCLPEGPYMYPLYIPNGAEARKKLHKKNIYVPTLWPEVLELCSSNDSEYNLTQDILPIPIDQRYNKADMEYLIDIINKCI